MTQRSLAVVMVSAMLLVSVSPREAPADQGDARAKVTEALRLAKQAEAAGAAQERDRFLAQTDRALQLALEAGATNPSHRLAEGVHALTETAALGREGRLPEGREDLQSAIIWLTREAGYPLTNPSADWTAGEPAAADASRIKRPGEKEAPTMDHFLIDIEEATVKNDNFRKVLFTAQKSQLVLMSLKPGEDIGAETHELDQFIRVESGRGTAQLNGKDFPIQDGSALVIPAGTKHNIINSGKDGPLKLYTIYSPPEHKDGIVHRTKQDAQADHEDHFDGKTTAMLQESSSQR